MPVAVRQVKNFLTIVNYEKHPLTRLERQISALSLGFISGGANSPRQRQPSNF
jgi:hypothetical protein